LKDLAEREELSIALVAKVVGKLRRGGVVTALRGRHGYYELVRRPEAITVADVLLALNNSVIQGCFNAEPGEQPSCPHSPNCSLRPVWTHLERTVTEAMGQMTLQDLLHKESQVSRQVRQLLPYRVSTSRRLKSPSCKPSPTAAQINRGLV
jgi:Rrf2 family protein